MEQVWEPARRFVLAQSWWIASEIARRHPKLLLIETHPGVGQYVCLTLIRNAPEGTTSLIDFKGVGRIHVHVADGFEPITWIEAFAAEGGHDVVRRLELAAGLTPLPKAPPTGTRIVTYRAIARVLSSLVEDRHIWDGRNGQIDSSGYCSGQRSELAEFPSVVAALGDRRPDDLFGVPAYRFWILFRDGEPVAVFDTDGRLHLRDRSPTELLPIYKRTRSLTATIGETLGRLLP
jgi:hypothetical protein